MTYNNSQQQRHGDHRWIEFNAVMAPKIFPSYNNNQTKTFIKTLKYYTPNNDIKGHATLKLYKITSFFTRKQEGHFLRNVNKLLCNHIDMVKAKDARKNKIKNNNSKKMIVIHPMCPWSIAWHLIKCNNLER